MFFNILCFLFGFPLFVFVSFKVYCFLHSTLCGPFQESGVVWKPLPSNGKRICVIGGGLSGIQSLKQATADGFECVLIERSDHLGGLWQFQDKPDIARPTVYKTTHIDTGRDLNSFGDHFVSQEKNLVMHNSDVAKYLNENVDKFDLRKNVLFNTNVLDVKPENENGDEETPVKWLVTFQGKTDKHPKVETFDGVMICTGRHGWPHVPKLEGIENFKGLVLHSAEYKEPDTHMLSNKRVCVIGIGNSGADIVTELGRLNENVHLVSRSGAHVFDLRGVPLTSMGQGGRLTALMAAMLPWKWQQAALQQALNSGALGDQEILKKAGLEPKHGPFQTHLTGTGLHGKTTFHQEIERKHIKVHKNIQKIGKDFVVFDNEIVEKIDCIIFATGFKQGVNFIDKNIIDLSPNRENNEVPLFMGMFIPKKKYESLCLINFVQSASFLLADLQTRVFFRVFKKETILPSEKVQKQWIVAVDKTLAEQYIDRPRHRVQHGISLRFYEELAELAKCRPTLLRVLKERPEAFYSAFFSPVFAGVYRLVGPGATEIALKEVQKRQNDLNLGSKRTSTPPGFIRFIVLSIVIAVAFVRGHDVSSRRLPNKKYMK